MNMKRLKLFTYYAIALSALTACSKDEGPSIDDYFLNYEIPEIPVTEDYQIGIFYNKNGDMKQTPNGDANFTRWEILTKLDAELNSKTNYNNLTPQVMPKSQQEGLLEVKGDDQSYRMIPMVQEHVDGCIEAGADFMILPELGVDLNQGPGTRLSKGDSLLVTMFLGRSGRGGNKLPIPHLGQPGRDFVDLRNMKIVVSINWNNIVDLQPKLSSSNCIEDVPGKNYNGVDYTRQQLLNNFFSEVGKCFFDDDAYYKVGGTRPMVYIKNKTGEMYAKNSKAMYDSIRRAVKEATGYDIYIVAESADVWCNQMRYQYFYMQGDVDAVASRNMYDQSEMTRSYMYPQMIDQNWKYNREVALPAFGNGMEYIPTIGPGWNKLVQDGRGAIGNTPIVERNPETYRTMCNVAKMNAGPSRLIFIDSYNKYNFNSFIEPTVENYGKGYGDTYLKITRQQFKKN